MGRFGFILACFNHSSSNVLLVYAGSDSATGVTLNPSRELGVVHDCPYGPYGRDFIHWLVKKFLCMAVWWSSWDSSWERPLTPQGSLAPCRHLLYSICCKTLSLFIFHTSLCLSHFCPPALNIVPGLKWFWYIFVERMDEWIQRYLTHGSCPDGAYILDVRKT